MSRSAVTSRFRLLTVAHIFGYLRSERVHLVQMQQRKRLTMRFCLESELGFRAGGVRARYTQNMYSAAVLEHSAHPRNFGELPDATNTVEATNPVCGDELRLAVRVEDGRIAAARFHSRGCKAAIASASLLTELMTGKSIDRDSRDHRGTNLAGARRIAGGNAAWQPTRRRRLGRASRSTLSGRLIRYPSSARSSAATNPTQQNPQPRSYTPVSARRSASGSFRFSTTPSSFVGTSSTSSACAQTTARAPWSARRGEKFAVKARGENHGMAALVAELGHKNGASRGIELANEFGDEFGADHGMIHQEKHHSVGWAFPAGCGWPLAWTTIGLAATAD